ncbi:hypothetical protein GF314_16595 [bacterium]|nr:hypothetical protein [bacterium]
MNSTRTDPPRTVSRRTGGDRRLMPTPMLSAYSLRGRRTRIRRDTDLLRGRYVDRSTGRHLILIVLLMLFVSLDAASTLWIIDRGGTEANPVMANTLERGVGWFLLVKLGPLPLAFTLLSVHRYFGWVKAALALLVVVYGALMIYHFTILARILVHADT